MMVGLTVYSVVIFSHRYLDSDRINVKTCVFLAVYRSIWTSSYNTDIKVQPSLNGASTMLNNAFNTKDGFCNHHVFLGFQLVHETWYPRCKNNIFSWNTHNNNDDNNDQLILIKHMPVYWLLCCFLLLSQPTLVWYFLVHYPFAFMFQLTLLHMYFKFSAKTTMSTIWLVGLD